MAVKQTTTENEQKLPVSRILDYIHEQEQQSTIIVDYAKIAKHIVEMLGFIDWPKLKTINLLRKEYKSIDLYLQKISEHVDIAKICSAELISVLKMDNPSPIAGLILHHVDPARTPKFYVIFPDKQHLQKAINHLLGWMRYTFFINNLDVWILKIFQDLQENKMFSILLDVAGENITCLMNLIVIPILQKQVESVFFYILTSVQHTPIIFDKIVGNVPKTLTNLHDSSLEQRFVDTIKALLELFKMPNRQDYLTLEELITKSYTVSANYKQQLEIPPWHDTSPIHLPLHTNDRVGLENLGNTCYMNSILQALALTKYFHHEMLFTETKSHLFNVLQRLLALLQHSNRPSLLPDKIFKAACPPSFHEGHQQDCSEFLGYLLESLHSQEKRCQRTSSNPMEIDSDNTSLDLSNGNTSNSTNSMALNSESVVIGHKTLVQKTFDGSISIVYKCLNCGTRSKQNDSFRDLHLSFPDTKFNTKFSVESLLEYYCSIERLDDDNKYFCDNCKMLCDGERVINFVHPPQYLVLTIKHFKYDKAINMRTKLAHNVTYDPELSITVWPEDGSKSFARYRLYAAVIHSGVSMDSGHYFTYGSDQLGKWYKFDDSRVTQCKMTEFTNLHSPNTPYVLFYERENDVVVSSNDTNRTEHYSNLNDLPIQLRNYVDFENNRYEMEKRIRQRHRTVDNAFSRKYSSDNDDNNPPPSSCGGNSFTNSNQYVC